MLAATKELTPYMKCSPETQIEYILTTFDFQQVLKTMKFLKWRWTDNGYKYYYPDVNDMKKFIRENLFVALVKNLRKGKHYSIQSGGFKLSRHHKLISLSFVLVESDAEDLFL